MLLTGKRSVSFLVIYRLLLLLPHLGSHWWNFLERLLLKLRYLGLVWCVLRLNLFLLWVLKLVSKFPWWRISLLNWRLGWDFRTEYVHFSDLLGSVMIETFRSYFFLHLNNDFLFLSKIVKHLLLNRRNFHYFLLLSDASLVLRSASAKLSLVSQTYSGRFFSQKPCCCALICRVKWVKMG